MSATISDPFERAKGAGSPKPSFSEMRHTPGGLPGCRGGVGMGVIGVPRREPLHAGLGDPAAGRGDRLPVGVAPAWSALREGLSPSDRERWDTGPSGSSSTGGTDSRVTRGPWLEITSPSRAFGGSRAISTRRGPFYSVFVREDTPEEVVATLEEAFATAAQDETFRTLMENRGNVAMGISGEESRAFLDRRQQVTAYAPHDSGAAAVDPASIGIERP